MSTDFCTKSTPAKVPPEAKENPRCPRCQSSETKFCYYNNYNLSQPRYFCKSCRRYWTLGGSLRDIPTGGTSRKNTTKRRRSSSSPVSHPPSSPTSPVSSTPVVLTDLPDATSTTTPTTDDVLTTDIEGTFKEILAEPMPEGFDLDMGLGLGPIEEIGFDIGNATTTTSWSFLPDDRSAIVTGDLPLGIGIEDTWHAPGEEGCDGGNDGGGRFAWADLCISSPGKKVRQ